MRDARYLSLVIVTLTLLAVACSGSNGVLEGRAGDGRIQIVLSAEPGDPVAAGAITNDGKPDRDDGPFIDSAMVTFSSILARNLEGRLIEIASELPRTVDLFSLVEQRSVSLPVGFLPPGTYDQLVVVMTKVELVLRDGTGIAITPPGGGWTAIVRTEPFEVVEGEVTTIELKFRRHGAFRWLGDRFDFKPEFGCRVGHDDD